MVLRPQTLYGIVDSPVRPGPLRHDGFGGVARPQGRDCSCRTPDTAPLWDCAARNEWSWLNATGALERDRPVGSRWGYF